VEEEEEPTSCEVAAFQVLLEALRPEGALGLVPSWGASLGGVACVEQGEAYLDEASSALVVHSAEAAHASELETLGLAAELSSLLHSAD